MDNPDGTSHWHLDKRVPIALIITIVLQFAILGMWVGTIQARVDRNERDLYAASENGERLARIEALLETIQARLNRSGD